MENTMDNLKSVDVCRLCPSSNHLFDIFDSHQSENYNLPEVIFMTSGVKILETDFASKKICERCRKITLSMYLFREDAMKQDQILKLKSITLEADGSNSIENQKSSEDPQEEQVNCKKETKDSNSLDNLLHHSVIDIYRTYPNIRLKKRWFLRNLNLVVSLNSCELESHISGKSSLRVLKTLRAKQQQSASSKKKKEDKIRFNCEKSLIKIDNSTIVKAETTGKDNIKSNTDSLEEKREFSPNSNAEEMRGTKVGNKTEHLIEQATDSQILSDQSTLIKSETIDIKYEPLRESDTVEMEYNDNWTDVPVMKTSEQLRTEATPFCNNISVHSSVSNLDSFEIKQEFLPIYTNSTTSNEHINISNEHSGLEYINDSNTEVENVYYGTDIPAMRTANLAAEPIDSLITLPISQMLPVESITIRGDSIEIKLDQLTNTTNITKPLLIIPSQINMPPSAFHFTVNQQNVRNE